MERGLKIKLKDWNLLYRFFESIYLIPVGVIYSLLYGYLQFQNRGYSIHSNSVHKIKYYFL